ncbi:MAG: hypothetical protein ACRECV_07445 [Xanthobacteraceae bacterium]
MTDISSPPNTTTLSPRTVKYVEALIREGDKFDYARWLQDVREEENRVKTVNLEVAPDDTKLNIPEERKIAINKSAIAHAGAPRFRIARRPPVPRAPRHAVPVAGPQSLQQRIFSVQAAWRAMTEKRQRSAIYGYFSPLFDLVMLYKAKQKREKLVRCALEKADLPWREKRVDPFAAVIRCTSNNSIDRKTISRWSRALRYAAKRKPPETSLKGFMRGEGGVNACADKYARLSGCHGR